MKRLLLATLLLCGCDQSTHTPASTTAQDTVITQLSIPAHLYPAGFADELQNNLNFFIDGVGVDEKAKVPYDTIQVEGDEIVKKYETNTTEIGLYLSILTEATKTGDRKALLRIKETLTTLEQAPKWNGLFYWPYFISENALTIPAEGLVPAVDNGNLAFALAGVAGAFMDADDTNKKEIVQRIETLLDAQKEGWAALYNVERGLLSGAWSTKENALLSYSIDRKANESRLSAAWAVLVTQDMGDQAVPVTAFNNMELYTKEYVINGKTYTPLLTWDGAYFQMMLPQIWLDERKLMPDYKMVEDHTAMQAIYAATYDIPMLSSSATVDDSYYPYGVPELSENKVRLDGYIQEDFTGTPHATALSYIVDPAAALSALIKLKEDNPQIQSPYGWYDAIDRNGNMTKNIISLDTGMFVSAFMAKDINADVERYLQRKGYMPLLQQMYHSYVPNTVIH